MVILFQQNAGKPKIFFGRGLIFGPVADLVGFAAGGGDGNRGRRVAGS
jgi:hypothetical protein